MKKGRACRESRSVVSDLGLPARQLGLFGDDENRSDLRPTVAEPEYQGHCAPEKPYVDRLAQGHEHIWPRSFVATQAIGCLKLPAIAKAALHAIHGMVNKDWRWSSSHELLAARTGLCVRSTQRGTRAAEAHGVLKVFRRRGEAGRNLVNAYELCPTALEAAYVAWHRDQANPKRLRVSRRDASRKNPSDSGSLGIATQGRSKVTLSKVTTKDIATPKAPRSLKASNVGFGNTRTDDKEPAPRDKSARRAPYSDAERARKYRERRKARAHATQTAKPREPGATTATKRSKVGQKTAHDQERESTVLAILDAGWNVIRDSSLELAMTEIVWRRRNRRGAVILASAGKKADDVVAALRRAHNDPKAGAYLRTLTSLCRLAEAWPQISELGKIVRRPPSPATSPSRQDFESYGNSGLDGRFR
jgi:hypothetical protein